jgi:MoCo/4Fe-4S cofactor protein with predicted Tat translocation signal
MAKRTTPTTPWRSLAEREGDPRIAELQAAEFSPQAADTPALPAEGASRRRFLSLLAAGAALAATGSGCSRDIDRGSIVPYTRRPEGLPGTALYYASAAQEGLEAHSLLIKTREARPILIEGNDEHPGFRGAASLRMQAELLALYDPDRLRGPLKDGQPTSWDEARRALAAAASGNGRCLLLTEAILSPSQAALIEDLKRVLPRLDHRAWEPAAEHGALAAARDLAGAQLKPVLHLDKARVVLCLDADPLGGEGAELRAIRDFANARQVASRAEARKATPLRLWAAESRLTLSGGKSDHRLPILPSQAAALGFALVAELADRGVPLPEGTPREELGRYRLESVAETAGLDPALLRALADDLQRAGRQALVIAGTPLPAEAHAAAWLLNRMLGAEGHTVEQRPAALTELLDPPAMVSLAGELAAGRYSTLIVWGVNPAHSLPAGANWAAALAGVQHSFRIGLLPDETAAGCDWTLAAHHWLESWGDFRGGLLQQPAVAPLHDTRQAEQILLDLAVDRSAPIPVGWDEYLKLRWQETWRHRGGPASFEAFWHAVLHDGLLAEPAAEPGTSVFQAAALGAHLRRAGRRAGDGGFELLLHPDRRIFDGRGANNGWLQELPEPVTKLTWGNPLLIGPADARRLGLASGDLVRITTGGRSLELPVAIQPGQKAGSLALALGYGRKGLSVAEGVGVNAWPLCPGGEGLLLAGVLLEPTGGRRSVHTTQEHHLMEGRDLIRRVGLAAYAAGETGGPKHHGAHHGDDHGKGHGELATGRDHGLKPEQDTPLTLYPTVEYTGRKWGMAIDLGACVGCAGCVIACQAENNIPVVGPERVDEGRELQWIRIDRYYEGDEDNPEMVTQPMLCQHCDNAPCENVCPVSATTHNEEGLNQMTYNRCVGTRYCANNCPYKVRRFNYYDYTAKLAESLQLAMNPEVSIRPRGVMEKCTFCVQRINDARSAAHAEGRPIRDGEVTTACAAACPAGAIVFGDLNDPASRVASLVASDRGYGVLAVLGVGPAITYLAEVKNPASIGGAHES